MKSLWIHKHINNVSDRVKQMITDSLSLPMIINTFFVHDINAGIMSTHKLEYKGDQSMTHRIGPVRYIISGYLGKKLICYYRAVYIEYFVTSSFNKKDIKSLHQFTIDLIDMYYEDRFPSRS